MSSSNCCFLAYIQISQEAGKVVWYSHFLKKFPQFIVIHTVKGFGVVNKEEVDVFLELSYFFDDPADVGNLISGSSAVSKSSLNIWKFTIHILLKPGLEKPDSGVKIIIKKNFNVILHTTKEQLKFQIKKTMSSTITSKNETYWDKFKKMCKICIENTIYVC